MAESNLHTSERTNKLKNNKLNFAGIINKQIQIMPFLNIHSFTKKALYIRVRTTKYLQERRKMAPKIAISKVDIEQGDC